MKVLTILGTRPEVIKMASVIKLMEKHPEDFESVVCVTAQHRQMLDQMVKIFEIRTDIDLDLMTENQTLPMLTSRAMAKLSEVVRQVGPDVVLVQGDTTTAMVAALAAFYERVNVGHIEAGMRTHDRYYPFPEEMNRRMISELATYHFAPTQRAVDALVREGIHPSSIFLTGSTAIDALRLIFPESSNRKPERAANNRKLVLVTAHRRESFGAGIENICLALRELAERNRAIDITYPVHPNPNVQGMVRKILSGLDNVHLVPPLDYLEFASVMKEAYLILTDSGGVQVEAPALGIPVLILRDETEWPEVVEAGVARLVGTDRTKIVFETECLLKNESEYQRMARAVHPCGDGKAAERILEALHQASI